MAGAIVEVWDGRGRKRATRRRERQREPWQNPNNLFVVLRLPSHPMSASSSSVPYLLPQKPPILDENAWRPSKYLEEPEPPGPDLERLAQEEAAQKAGMDPRAIKKVKPRKTVDYHGGIGRWNDVRF